MSNTLDLSRVVFTHRWVESDRDRKRKWVHGAWSVAPEVTVNRSEGGWKSRQTDSIGSGGVSSSWQESIGLSEASSRVRENISQPWGVTSALHVKYTSFLKPWGDTIALTACNISRSLRHEAKVNFKKHCTRPLYLVLLRMKLKKIFTNLGHWIRWSPFADIFDPLLNYTLLYIY